MAGRFAAKMFRSSLVIPWRQVPLEPIPPTARARSSARLFRTSGCAWHHLDTVFGSASMSAARSFNSRTVTSSPPTINNVGAALPEANRRPVGRPPRETTARTRSGRSVAAIRAAAAPVLAPNRPIFIRAVSPAINPVDRSRNRRQQPDVRRKCVAFVNTMPSEVSRSNSRVANPASLSTSATNRFRELKRLLPLPVGKQHDSCGPFRSGERNRVASPDRFRRSPRQ